MIGMNLQVWDQFLFTVFSRGREATSVEGNDPDNQNEGSAATAGTRDLSVNDRIQNAKLPAETNQDPPLPPRLSSGATSRFQKTSNRYSSAGRQHSRNVLAKRRHPPTPSLQGSLTSRSASTREPRLQHPGVGGKGTIYIERPTPPPQSRHTVFLAARGSPEGGNPEFHAVRIRKGSAEGLGRPAREARGPHRSPGLRAEERKARGSQRRKGARSFAHRVLRKPDSPPPPRPSKTREQWALPPPPSALRERPEAATPSPLTPPRTPSPTASEPPAAARGPGRLTHRLLPRPGTPLAAAGARRRY